MPLYSFDGSVPAPELVNMGEDFDAIYRSLDAYSSWLLAHNPDVGLVGEFAHLGSSQYETYQDGLAGLAQNNRRYYSDRHVESVELVDSTGTAATLRVAVSAGTRRIVDASGGLVDEEPSSAHAYVVLLTADQTGRWRLSSIEELGEEVTEL